MRACLVAATILVALVAPSVASADLTNLDHLDYLGDAVTPPAQAGHTTYGDGPIGVLWTYADAQPGGGFKRIGGGTYDAATNTYGQGAFNADDIARAAVVYTRHWRQTGSTSSRARARALLRGLAYLQTASGPNAGNVVLWMQPDGTLHPSAEPHEEPDPSDSGPSYWLARTVWALGEGQRAFAHDREFAAFLRDRLDVAIAALDRQVLSRYGTYQTVDGRSVPAWLIVDGADATAEAMLGLAAYDAPASRRAVSRFAEGVAALGAGSPRAWPYGALLPWALSQADWHAWASQMPTALAASGRRDLLGRAVADAASFTPHLLVTGGPDNGWLPSPSDRTQIAYGADSRLQGLLAVARAAHRPGLRRLAGVAAAWYFGANAAGVPMYDPATGVTFDGVSADGTINHNGGAESTIHGLLSMLALDAHPAVARWARVANVSARDTRRVVEAETATLSRGAQVVTPPSAWTGESAWSDGAYVELPAGGEVTFGPTDGFVEVVALRTEGAGGGATGWGPTVLDHSNAGPQGASGAPGRIEVLPLGERHGELVARQAGDGVTALDAIQVGPLIERVTLRGGGREQTLLRSFADGSRRVDVAGRATAYDARGRVVSRGRDEITIPSGGFAIASTGRDR
jgi:hypothetical protein